MRKVNDDICAIDIEVHNKALDLLRDRFNLNKIIRPLDKHVVLKNYNHIHELYDFPAFVILDNGIAEPVASALDNVSIKMYYDDIVASLGDDENDRAVTYDQVLSGWAQSNMPSYYRPGNDYQSAEEFLADMGTDYVNDSIILANYKMAIDVLLRAEAKP
ncbi:hypothetical protein BSP75_19615 [Aeromonas sp. YN13HZO-058]|uniref:hypothetical protein n=1 Tax=Aeromonas sp. YN13HZO-058 TaxID=1921564 RepID=UPI000946A0F7|nr:hypothetical protein [Aeromonas sp. YN13HZO-058]OLF19976.1 hypothetical protein BSP75_19615 [Aeromonas sp. YN13HZO-058]